jgi:hypothetical protein
LARRVQAFTNDTVVERVGGVQHDLGADHIPVRGRILAL